MDDKTVNNIKGIYLMLRYVLDDDNISPFLNTNRCRLELAFDKTREILEKYNPEWIKKQ